MGSDSPFQEGVTYAFYLNPSINKPVFAEVVEDDLTTDWIEVTSTANSPGGLLRRDAIVAALAVDATSEVAAGSPSDN